MNAFHRAPLAEDSYQYLNVAEHLEHGQGACTSLVHFDSERSHGRMPAPLTTFPPGYPVAIMMASVFSGNLELGGRMISGIGFVGTTALLVWALMVAGVSVPVRQFVLLLFITNALNLEFATAVLTEQLFILLITGSVATLIWAENDSVPLRSKTALVLIGFTAAGLAYWVRYAGLFFIAALVCYAVLKSATLKTATNRRLRTLYLGAACIPIVIAGSGMVRNLMITGSWKGGNEMTVSHPLAGVLVNFAQAQEHLLLGLHPVMFGLWEGCALAGGVGLLGVIIANAGNWRLSSKATDMAASLVVLIVVVYSAGIFYAGLRTVITFGTRMFLPVLPLYMLALGIGLTWLTRDLRSGVRRVWLSAAMGLFAAGYIGVNARDLYAPSSPARVALLATIYAKPMADGKPLLQWVQFHISPHDTIASADGQATGFLLRRNTLSLVRSRYSLQKWERDELWSQMKRFGARFLILYRPSADEGEPVTGESKFIAHALYGPPPAGFKIAAENADVRILEFSEDSERRLQSGTRF